MYFLESEMRRVPLYRRLCCRWIALYAVVFTVIMPFVGQNLFYSVYRSGRWSYKTMQEKVLGDHNRALVEAKAYVRTLESRSEPLFAVGFVELAIVVVTSRRVIGSSPVGYLTRTIAALHRLSDSSSWRTSKHVFICDVNAGPAPHIEADRLRQYFHVVVRFPNASASAAILDPFEKEKQDYACCMERALQLTSTFVLMVEDDAVADDNLFSVLPQVLYTSVQGSELRTWSHLKLYYPERWQGFSLDMRTALELMSMFCITYVWSTTLNRYWQGHRNTTLNSLAAGFLVVLTALAIGRQHIIELKRISPYLYSLAADSGCCSPAVLYKAEFAKILVPYLVNQVQCSNSYPLDMALNSLVSNVQSPGFRVEPNLFRHIGLISTIKGHSRYIEDFLL